MLKRFWCWLRDHPYPRELVCGQEEWPFNSTPPRLCTHCRRWL
jgi:hypothetical protein